MQPDRRTSTWVILAFVMGIATTWWPAPIAGSGAETKQGAVKKEVTVYYFHGTLRCNTCRTIEAYAKEALEARYGEQLKSSLLMWKVVNIDEPENEHFVDEFGLVSSSLVVVARSGGKVTSHETLQDAWTLVRDKPRFMEYVQRAVGGYLK